MNLVDVILCMKVFGFGDIEWFLFINMLVVKLICLGYVLLEELGVIENLKDEG